MAEIIEREIQRSGTFREALADYAHAFARTERFDTASGEEILRDIFKARYAQTMNAMREGLAERKSTLGDTLQKKALDRAMEIPASVRANADMPFYRAYDIAANKLAAEHGITETAAKEMMKAAFAQAEGRELYTAGKEAESSRHTADEGRPAARRTPRRSKSRAGPSR